MKNFTDIEQRVLNRIQKDWLITENPYKPLSDELHLNEDELIQIIDNLKKEKIIREISGIFNAAGLGYESSLIAFAVPENNIEKAAGIINAHSGISHNYLRDHRYSIWFTLTVNKKRSIEKETEELAEKCDVKDFLILKNEKLFKIGVMFHISEEDSNADSYETNPAFQDNGHYPFGELSKEQKKAVCILQTDLPLMTRPFKYLIEKLNINIDEKKVLKLGEAFKEQGIMRRYSAIIKHSKAGYNFNAMTAWKFNNADDTEIIKIFSKIPNVSHLYFRTVYPGKWEHGLFAMIHARTGDELNKIIKTIEVNSGMKDYLVLNSLKEFKKRRVKYFEEEFIKKNLL